MDHRNGVGHGHGASLAFHAHYSVHPLAKILGSSGRVVLPGEASESGTPEGVTASDVASSASPKQIGGRRILFMTVDVSDFNVSC
jgi:hypothetical protein